MKSFLFIAVISLTGYQVTQSEKGLSNASRIGGVYVFIDSEPSSEYEVMESGKVTMMLDCNEVVNKPVKKAIKQKADGVIIHFQESRYDLIKFK